MNEDSTRLKKNDIYEITIEDIGNDGEGIGHIEGMAIFVKDTVVGDEAKVKLVKVKKNYAYGRLEEIIKPSPFRVNPVCANARRCGGCALMHMSYDKQLDYKWNKVKNCLERIGGVKDVASIMEPICGMKEPYHYRNKMQFPVGLDKEGNVQIGFYAGRTHSIIDLNECYIGHPVNDFLAMVFHSSGDKGSTDYHLRLQSGTPAHSNQPLLPGHMPSPAAHHHPGI